MKQTKHRQPASKTKIVFSNPIFQRTYEAAKKNAREAKNLTPEQARAFMRRICAA